MDSLLQRRFKVPVTKRAGYCYTRMLGKALAEKAAAELGQLPTLAEFQRFCVAEGLDFDEHHGVRMEVDQATSYIHLEYADDTSTTLRQLLSLTRPHDRIGSTVAAAPFAALAATALVSAAFLGWQQGVPAALICAGGFVLGLCAHMLYVREEPAGTTAPSSPISSYSSLRTQTGYCYTKLLAVPERGQIASMLGADPTLWELRKTCAATGARTHLTFPVSVRQAGPQHLHAEDDEDGSTCMDDVFAANDAFCTFGSRYVFARRRTTFIARPMWLVRTTGISLALCMLFSSIAHFEALSAWVFRTLFSREFWDAVYWVPWVLFALCVGAGILISCAAYRWNATINAVELRPRVHGGARALLQGRGMVRPGRWRGPREEVGPNGRVVTPKVDPPRGTGGRTGPLRPLGKKLQLTKPPARRISALLHNRYAVGSGDLIDTPPQVTGLTLPPAQRTAVNVTRLWSSESEQTAGYMAIPAYRALYYAMPDYNLPVLTRRRHPRVLDLPRSLNPAQQAFIKETFTAFDFTFDSPNATPHPLAASLRDLARASILAHIPLGKRVVCVGGNARACDYAQYALDGLVFLNPNMEGRDAHRIADAKAHAEALDAQGITPECHDLALQECDERFDVAILLQSAFNIDPRDVAFHFDRLGVQTGYVTMYLNADMLTEAHGIIPAAECTFERYTDGRTAAVEFMQVAEVGEAYVHKLEYLELLAYTSGFEVSGGGYYVVTVFRQHADLVTLVFEHTMERPPPSTRVVLNPHAGSLIWHAVSLDPVVSGPFVRLETAFQVMPRDIAISVAGTVARGRDDISSPDTTAHINNLDKNWDKRRTNWIVYSFVQLAGLTEEMVHALMLTTAWSLSARLPDDKLLYTGRRTDGPLATLTWMFSVTELRRKYAREMVNFARGNFADRLVLHTSNVIATLDGSSTDGTFQYGLTSDSTSRRPLPPLRAWPDLGVVEPPRVRAMRAAKGALRRSLLTAERYWRRAQSVEHAYEQLRDVEGQEYGTPRPLTNAERLRAANDRRARVAAAAAAERASTTLRALSEEASFARSSIGCNSAGAAVAPSGWGNGSGDREPDMAEVEDDGLESKDGDGDPEEGPVARRKYDRFALGHPTVYNTEELLADKDVTHVKGCLLGHCAYTLDACLLQAMFTSPQRYEERFLTSGLDRVTFAEQMLQRHKAVVIHGNYYIATGSIGSMDGKNAVAIELRDHGVERLIPDDWKTLEADLKHAGKMPLKSKKLTDLLVAQHLQVEPGANMLCYWSVTLGASIPPALVQKNMCLAEDIRAHAFATGTGIIHGRTLYMARNLELMSLSQIVWVDGTHAYRCELAAGQDLAKSLDMLPVALWNKDLNGALPQSLLAGKPHLERLLVRQKELQARIDRVSKPCKKAEQVAEYLRYENTSLGILLEGLRLALYRSDISDLAGVRDVHIYNTVQGRFINRRPDHLQQYAWNGREFTTIEYNRRSRTYSDDARSEWLFMSPAISFLKEQRVVDSYGPFLEELMELDYDALSITLVDGVPGCGKTTSIIKDHTAGVDMVATASKEGREEILLRMEGKHPDFYRTFDSILLNGAPDCTVIHMDEATMAHAGSLILVMLTCKASKAYLHGDSKQIGFINRLAGITLLHSRIEPDFVEHVSVSHRCPKSAIEVLRGAYPAISTTNERVGSIHVLRVDAREQVPEGYDAYLTFTQGEKSSLSEVIPNKVLTIHEAEGKTWERVAVVRLVKQKNRIYDSVEHMIVATSRHRDRFAYFTADTEDTYAEILSGHTSIKVLEKVPMERIGLATVQVHTPLPPRHLYRRYTQCAEASRALWGSLVQYFTAFTNANTTAPPTCIREVWDSGDEHRRTAPSRVSAAIAQDTLQVLFEPTNEHAQELLYAQEIVDLPAGVSIDPVKFMGQQPREGAHLEPVIDTPQPVNCRGSFTELMHSATVRNLNPVDQTGERSHELAEELRTRFTKAYLDADKLAAARTNATEHMAAWQDEFIATRTPAQKGQLLNAKPHETDPNVYDTHVRPSHKPSLKNDHNASLPAGQVVTAHKPMTTARFTACARSASAVLLEALLPQFTINVGLTQGELDGHMNQVLQGVKVAKLLEVDFSKFDKSQEDVILDATVLILQDLGMADDAAAEWLACHKQNTLVFHNLGLRVTTEYQRRSGDAFTLLGNTLVAMMILAYVYDMEQCIGGVFGGDDSLLVFIETAAIPDRSALIAQLFNLTAKIEAFPLSPYFSSKFLVFAEGRYQLVPDPVKMMTRLGRHDMHSDEHVRYYHLSFRDNMKAYASQEVRQAITAAAENRYHHLMHDCAISLEPIVDFLARVMEDEALMVNLYTGPRWMKKRRMPVTKKLSVDRAHIYKDPLFTWSEIM